MFFFPKRGRTFGPRALLRRSVLALAATPRREELERGQTHRRGGEALRAGVRAREEVREAAQDGAEPEPHGPGEGAVWGWTSDILHCENFSYDLYWFQTLK